MKIILDERELKIDLPEKEKFILRQVLSLAKEMPGFQLLGPMERIRKKKVNPKQTEESLEL